jgi:FixJ family two-component response regulator
VILDLEMPGVDGFEVLRIMRERQLDVPVIVYTGTGDYDRCAQAIPARTPTASSTRRNRCRASCRK